MKEFGNLITRHFLKLEAKIQEDQIDWQSISDFPFRSILEQQKDFVLQFIFRILPEGFRTDRSFERLILWYIYDGKIDAQRYLKPEDFPKVGDALELFQLKKPKLPKDKRNINEFATWATFNEFLEPYREVVFLTTNEKRLRDIQFLNRTDASLVFESSRVRVIHIKTEAAALVYGKGTKWCVSYTDKPNFFSNYSNDLLLIEEANGARKLLHIYTAQLKNEADKQLNVDDFFQTYPELIDVLTPFYEAATKKAIHEQDYRGFDGILKVAKDVSIWRKSFPADYLSNAVYSFIKAKKYYLIYPMIVDCMAVAEWKKRVADFYPGLMQKILEERNFTALTELLSGYAGYLKEVLFLKDCYFLETFAAALHEEDAQIVSSLLVTSSLVPSWQTVISKEQYRKAVLLLAMSGEAYDAEVLSFVDKNHAGFETVNYNLLEAMAAATAYKNKKIVKEFLKISRATVERKRTVCTKLIEFLDSILLQKNSSSLIETLIQLRKKEGERLFDSYQLLIDFLEPIFSKRDRPLHDFLKLLPKLDDDGYWRREIIWTLLDSSKKKSDEIIMALLKSYGFENAVYSISNKNYVAEAMQQVVTKAVMHAANNNHETSLALLLYAVQDRPRLRDAVSIIADSAVAALEKVNAGSRDYKIDSDIAYAIKQLKSAVTTKG